MEVATLNHLVKPSARFSKDRVIFTIIMEYLRHTFSTNINILWFIELIYIYIYIYKITRVLSMLRFDEPHYLSEYGDTVDVIFILY